LRRNYKVKQGKQKYSIFAEQPIQPTGNFRFTEDRIAKTSRQIDLSLRSVVMDKS